MRVKHQIEQSAPESQQPEIDGFRTQHLVLGEREVATEAAAPKWSSTRMKAHWPGLPGDAGVTAG